MGKITLSSDIINWKWYKDRNTMRLFIHCLLIADENGQFAATLKELSKQTGLSIREVRTALSHLEATQEATRQATQEETQNKKPKTPIFTMKNYSRYTLSDTTSDTRSDTRSDTKTEHKKSSEDELNSRYPSDLYQRIIDYFNKRCGTHYRNSQTNQSYIRPRLNDGFTEDDFYRAIDNKVADWLGTEQEKFLRPSTLFGAKFEMYLNQHNTRPKDVFDEWRDA